MIELFYGVNFESMIFGKYLNVHFLCRLRLYRLTVYFLNTNEEAKSRERLPSSALLTFEQSLSFSGQAKLSELEEKQIQV